MESEKDEERQAYHVSLFTYDHAAVPYSQKKQQDSCQPTGQYDDDGNEIVEHLWWCYPRIVMADSEEEAEEKFIEHIVETAALPAHYEIEINLHEPEDCEDEDSETGYSLVVVN